jgi:DNA-binding MarR family transcriptional regulator/GNAT superfamily N-acetyltransferase
MDSALVDRVRRFNRTVTQRVGALDDAYLSRSRPLGQARLLWEIGADGSEVRSLRSRLDLDSGYLSRLIRSLEADGLATVEPDPADKRVRIVRLTDFGRRERELLDESSDELAWSLLAPLSDAQRSQLVDAMARVERLLTAGLVEAAVEDPRSPAAEFCLQSYFRELDQRFDTGFDPGRSRTIDRAEVTEPAGLLLVARLRGEPIGCGALRLHGDDPAEIKHLWVSPAARGLGVGRRIVTELEQHARRYGVRVVHLDTNRALREATSLYRSAGYAEVAPFNDEAYADHWFEKRLA